MPPRITFDISPLLTISTGIGYYTANLVSHLMALQPEIQWSFFSIPGRKPKEVDIQTSSEVIRQIIDPWFLPARATSLLLQAPLHRLLAVESFIGASDLFHWTNFLCCSQRTGKKILTVHDVSFVLFPEYHPLKRRFLFKSFFPRSLEQADHIITVSQNTKQDLVRYFHVPPEGITVIPLAADETFRPICPEDAAATLTRYGIRYAQYVLYVGTLEPRKNLPRLLQAYHLFRNSHSESVPMVLTGANGWLNKGLFAEIERSPWRSDIKILGYVAKADLSALYSGALAFVYPSIYEGFGLPPLEAMACGAPVITSNNSSLPEVVGDAGLLVDPLDVDEIARAMLKIADNLVLRETLCKRGIERARTFNWKITAQQTLDVYEKTLDQKNA
jgi:glycosyltransferase involved in cell wall biosynthesis